MSNLAELFRAISTKKDILSDSKSDSDDNVALDIDRYSENKYIELQLNESIRLKHSTLDQIQNEYDQKVEKINEHYNEKVKNLQELYSQLSSAPVGITGIMLDNITNLMAGFEELRKKELKQALDVKTDESTKAEEHTKQLTQSIYQQSIIDNLLNKLNTPSSDLEFGLAMGILLHNDPTFSNDENCGEDSQELLRQYFLKELDRSNTHSQKIFEEHLINHAKEILLKLLSSKATPFGSKKIEYIVELKPDAKTIKLTDTDIRHSFVFKKI